MSRLATISAREAKRRIENGLPEIRAQLAPYASSLSDQWIGDALQVHAVVLRQAVAARIEVLDELVRIEVHLPTALAWMGGLIAAPVRRTGTKLLDDRSA